jgi:hypothetical protein
MVFLLSIHVSLLQNVMRLMLFSDTPTQLFLSTSPLESCKIGGTVILYSLWPVAVELIQEVLPCQNPNSFHPSTTVWGPCLRYHDGKHALRAEEEQQKPTITISREFGCEAYPMAELLRQQLEKRTKESWTLMDKALLDEVAKHHSLSDQVLQNIGDKNRFLDDFLSTFSNRWKSDKDYYRLLSRQIIALAEQGNVILVGRGAPIVTRNMKNCFHFRIYASETVQELPP